jgi:hypothetical protein
MPKHIKLEVTFFTDSKLYSFGLPSFITNLHDTRGKCNLGSDFWFKKIVLFLTGAFFDSSLVPTDGQKISPDEPDPVPRDIERDLPDPIPHVSYTEPVSQTQRTSGQLVSWSV